MTELARHGHPPGKFVGTLIFWISVALLLFAPNLSSPWCILLALIAIEPIIYATHEALHCEAHKHGRPAIANPAVVSTLGMSLQLQNIEILRYAHLFHHRMGRYGDGWAPDVTPGIPTLRQKLRYYAYLTALPAILWQLAGFVRPFLPLKHQSHLILIGYSSRVNARFLVSMLLTIGFVTYFIDQAGIVSFALFWIGLCFLWSIQQNIAHYGLRGVDAATDRVCAHTYYLQWPFSWLTYGSTAHFLHHADVTIPSESLYSAAHLIAQEERYQIKVVVKEGIRAYFSDILKQFRGPVAVSDLDLSWLSSSDRRAPIVEGAFDYRRGRTYTHP